MPQPQIPIEEALAQIEGQQAQQTAANELPPIEESLNAIEESMLQDRDTQQGGQVGSFGQRTIGLGDIPMETGLSETGMPIKQEQNIASKAVIKAGRIASEVLKREEAIGAEAIESITKSPKLQAQFIGSLALPGLFGNLVGDLAKQKNVKAAFEGKKDTQLGDVYRKRGVPEPVAALMGLTLSAGLPSSIAAEAVIGKALKSKPLQKLGAKIKKAPKQPFQDLTTATSGVSQEAIQHAQEKGFKNFFTKTNRGEKAINKVGNDINELYHASRKRIGTQLGNVKKALVSGEKGKLVKIDNAVKTLKQNFSDIGVVLDDTGKVVTEFGILSPETKIRNTFKKISNLSKDNAGNLKDVSFRESFAILRDLDNIIPAVKLSTPEGAFLAQFRKSLSDSIRSNITNKKLSSEFVKLNDKFGKLSNIGNNLKESGIFKLDKGNLKFNRIAGQNKLAKFFKEVDAGELPFRTDIEDLSKFFKEEGISDFLPKLKNIAAAREFSDRTFKGIRTGIISGALGGGGLAAAGPLGALGGAAAGVGMSTPRALAFMMSAGQNAGKGIATAAGATTAARAPLLRKLIQISGKD